MTNVHWPAPGDTIVGVAICQEKLLEIVFREKLFWQTSYLRSIRDQPAWLHQVAAEERVIWRNIPVIIHCQCEEECRPRGPLEMFIKRSREGKEHRIVTEQNVTCDT